MRTKREARRLLALLFTAMFTVWGLLLSAMLAAAEIHPTLALSVLGIYLIGSVNDEIRRYAHDENILEQAEVRRRE